MSQGGNKMSEQTTPETDAAWACFKGHTELLHDVQNLSRKLERERDEARADLEFRRELYKVLEGANSHLMTVTEEAVKLARALKEERDEAREERDEARQALMKIEDLFIDGTDIYADRENMGISARNALEGVK